MGVVPCEVSKGLVPRMGEFMSEDRDIIIVVVILVVGVSLIHKAGWKISYR